MNHSLSAIPFVNNSPYPVFVSTLPKKPLFGLLLGLVLSLAIWYIPQDLTDYGRMALITFVVAVVGWIFTDINDTYIAIVAALVFTVAGIDQPNEFFGALGDPMIWLLLASFIIAAGVTASGLSSRLTLAVASRTNSVNQLFYGLTAIMLSTAFFIPATSGRAALMLPIFISLSKGINNPRISRALGLLFPTVILLSAVTSMIGAGAHLVMVDIVTQMGGESISFGWWIVLGLPFGLTSCFISTWVILRIFLTHGERTQSLELTTQALASTDTKLAALSLENGVSRREWTALVIVLILVAMWSTEKMHGMSAAIVALLGALVVTLPQVNLVSFKDALKTVEWNMLLFMAATLKLSDALLDSNAATWLVENGFSMLQGSATSSAVTVLSMVTVVSLTSHLLITSRTARASVLVPLVVLLGNSLGYNPTMLAFISTAAAGFCLTLPVSAKPIAMFSKVDVPTYAPQDLLKLSTVLLPIHFGLLVLFALWVWPALGLTLQ